MNVSFPAVRPFPSLPSLTLSQAFSLSLSLTLSQALILSLSLEIMKNVWQRDETFRNISFEFLHFWKKILYSSRTTTTTTTTTTTMTTTATTTTTTATTTTRLFEFQTQNKQVNLFRQETSLSSHKPWTQKDVAAKCQIANFNFKNRDLKAVASIFTPRFEVVTHVLTSHAGKYSWQ